MSRSELHVYTGGLMLFFTSPRQPHETGCVHAGVTPLSAEELAEAAEMAAFAQAAAVEVPAAQDDGADAAADAGAASDGGEGEGDAGTAAAASTAPREDGATPRFHPFLCLRCFVA